LKIFGICLIKNEADCIEEILSKASTWCDKIFVFDTGSDDDSWEKVLSLARENHIIIPFKKEKRKFRDELRAEVFNNYKHLAQDGDWWCRLDADEIYIDNPRHFLKQIPKSQHVVWNASFQYYFTEVEKSVFEQSPDSFDKMELEGRIKYYLCNHSEIRFFKFRSRLTWKNGSWPRHLGITACQRIKLKHYQYRSPSQMQKRLVTRLIAIQEGYHVFASYTKGTHWEQSIKDSNTLKLDDGSKNYSYDNGLLPKHIERWDKRLLKYILHTVGIFP